MPPVADDLRADAPIDGLDDGHANTEGISPHAASAPDATASAFDIDAVSDDLLPTWNLDLD